MDAAISRGTVSTQDREDTITQGTLCAYELAQQYDPTRGAFEHQLRYVLSRRLRSQRSTDALDYAAEIEEVSPAHVAATSDEVPAEVDLSILPPRLQAIARVAKDGKYMKRMAKRTGRSVASLRREMTKIRTALKGEIKE